MYACTQRVVAIISAYIHIYTFVCVCVCVCSQCEASALKCVPTCPALGLVERCGTQRDRLAAAFAVARVDDQLVGGAGLEAAYAERRYRARQIVHERADGQVTLRRGSRGLELHEQRELLLQTPVETLHTLDVQRVRRRVLHRAVVRRVRATCARKSDFVFFSSSFIYYINLNLYL